MSIIEGTDFKYDRVWNGKKNIFVLFKKHLSCIDEYIFFAGMIMTLASVLAIIFVVRKRTSAKQADKAEEPI